MDKCDGFCFEIMGDGSSGRTYKMKKIFLLITEGRCQMK